MRPLAIAIGNSLRGDDGIAHTVIERLNVESMAVTQLTPEIAAELAGHDPVIFIDADVRATTVEIDPVDERTCGPALTHASTPGEIVALARALFGFAGRAFLCGIPADRANISR